MNSKPTMFIGSSSEGLQIARAMHSNLRRDVEVTVWPDDVFKPTKGTLESLAEAVNRFDFAAFVLSGDDAATIRKQELTVVRDNVALEAGMFIGKLGRTRVFLVVPSELPDDKKLHLPTDLLGTTTLDYEATRSDNNWKAATASACEDIKGVANELGGMKTSIGIVAYGDAVTLATFDGSYVQVDSSEPGILTATSRETGAWDRVQVCSATGSLAGRSVKFGDSIGLKVLKSEKYVGANLNGENKELTACALELDTYETFLVTPTQQGCNIGDSLLYGASFALKAHNRLYVLHKVDTDAKELWAEIAKPEVWERFMFVEPERR